VTAKPAVSFPIRAKGLLASDFWGSDCGGSANTGAAIVRPTTIPTMAVEIRDTNE
jgi:hypothetical protein